MRRSLASAAVIGGLAWLLFAGLFGGGALAQRPPFLPTFTPTRTPARIVPTATPAPVLTATPLPVVTPVPTATPRASGWDVSANGLTCVAAPISRRLGPGAKVEVITSTGRWEIRPNPAGADKCWLTVEQPPRAVAVGAAFTIRWSLGAAYEEVEAGIVVPIRATRGYYPAASTPPSAPRIQLARSAGPVALVSFTTPQAQP